MRKIWALYQNEMIKIVRRVSVWVILGLMVLVVAGSSGLIRLATLAINSMDFTDDNWTADRLADQQTERADYERQLRELLAEQAQENDPVRAQERAQEIADAREQAALFGEACDRGILLYGGDGGFTADALQKLVTCRLELEDLQANAEQDLDAARRVRLLEEVTARLNTALDENDYAAYLDAENRLIRAQDALTDAEKDDRIYLNDLRAQADPEGALPFEITSAVEQVGSMRQSLRTGLDANTGAGLTADSRAAMEDRLALTTYKLENRLYGSESEAHNILMTGLISMGVSFIAVLMMTLGGGSVSSEISSGTIKSLIISPTKRWKIFTAKLLSLLTVGLAATLILYGVSTMASLLFFGPASMTPYLTAAGGKVFALPFALYRLADLLLQFVDVVVFMLFAFMLSTTTRNTAASVGISMGIYFSGNLITGMLTLFARQSEVVKFIPFINLGLNTRVFPVDSDSMVGLLAGGVSRPLTSLPFAVCYLAVTCFCLLYIAKDSFCRRDI